MRPPSRGDPPEVLVSACLLGRACRYDGDSRAISDSPEADLGAAARRRLGLAPGPPLRLVPVCPEQLGGLGTPRPAAQLVGGDGAAVLAGDAAVRRVADGRDVTAAFVAGARRAAAAAPGAALALLKARSPSCGASRTWIGGRLRAGDGVFAALLRARGIAVQIGDEPL